MTTRLRQMTIRVPEELAEQIERVAKRAGMSRAAAVNLALAFGMQGLATLQLDMTDKGTK
jgi:predicted DNA-binding protein